MEFDLNPFIELKMRYKLPNIVIQLTTPRNTEAKCLSSYLESHNKGTKKDKQNGEASVNYMKKHALPVSAKVLRTVYT